MYYVGVFWRHNNSVCRVLCRMAHTQPPSQSTKLLRTMVRRIIPISVKLIHNFVKRWRGKEIKIIMSIGNLTCLL